METGTRGTHGRCAMYSELYLRYQRERRDNNLAVKGVS